MAAMANYSKSSSDSLDFSDAEIRSELSRLGYNDIDEEQFEEFKRGSSSSATNNKLKLLNKK